MRAANMAAEMLQWVKRLLTTFIDNGTRMAFARRCIVLNMLGTIGTETVRTRALIQSRRTLFE